ncbi:MAG TPA: HAMP domain-containing sensor histidine kinase [Rhodocyclaceae bacterium]|nr:HAMP domain-containing sensor histidine kinase [Rhodocyclaceae bacterium]
MSFYPRSLLRMVLVGNLLMMLPLAAAIIYAEITVERISEQSELIAGEANRAGQISWGLPEDLRHMDRILRQYGVLHDASLFDDYAAARQEWRRRAMTFAEIPLMAGLSARVREMLIQEENAYQQLGSSGAGLPQLQTAIGALLDRSVAMADEAGRIVDAEGTSFRARAAELRQRLAVAIVVGIGTAGVLLLLGRRLMGRLLGRVENAVQALGEGHLDRKIHLSGPDDLKRIGERLDWLRCRLRELEEQRTRVLRHVSHELKTPLAALREGSSLLSDQVAGTLTPQQSRIVGIMHGNALRLQTLIDGLLRLQRAEHALERFERIRLRLDDLIQQVLATHQLALRDKHLRIVGTLAPLSVTGGREEMTTIVSNIVANAVKYSPAGGTVSISLTRDGDQAVLDVMDQGPGIPTDERAKIFEPFYRARATEHAAGTGLGLAIASEFVHAHHGSLDLIESSTGAHFQIHLPLSREMT